MANIYKRCDCEKEGKRRCDHPYYSVFIIAGERIRKSLETADKQIAEEKLIELRKTYRLRQTNRGQEIQTNVPWDGFVARYLNEHRAILQDDTTVRLDTQALTLAKEALNLRYVHEMNPAALEQLAIRWKGAGRGNYIINRNVRSIKKAMRQAEEWKLRELIKPGEKTWASVISFEESDGRLLFYTVPQLRTLYMGCNGNWETIARLGARAGLRRGEMYWLEPKNLRFADRVIVIEKKVNPFGEVLWTPKSKKSARIIPMAPDLYDYLRRLPLQTKYVLGEETSRPSLDVMTNYFKTVVDRCKLEGSIHTLRHTFGSHLAQAGVDLYVIRDLMGHSSIEETQIYAKLMPENHAKGINKLPNIDFPNPNGYPDEPGMGLAH